MSTQVILFSLLLSNTMGMRGAVVQFGGFPMCFLHGRFPLMNALPSWAAPDGRSLWITSPNSLLVCEPMHFKKREKPTARQHRADAHDHKGCLPTEPRYEAKHQCRGGATRRGHDASKYPLLANRVALV